MRWNVLEGAAPDDVQQLLRPARRRRYRKGESIMHEGDPADSLHLIDSGYVAVRVTTPAGDVATLRVVGPNEHIGDLALFTGQPRSATVTALSNVETLELRYADIEAFRSEHPAFEQAILVMQANQIRTQSTQLLEAMYLAAPARIARRLADLCGVYDSPTVPLTQDDLAGMSGTTRQTVNQVLVELRDRGVVEIGRGRVTVLDPDGLSRAGR